MAKEATPEQVARVEKVYGRLKADYFSLLEVENNPTEAEVRVAYLRLAKEFHPDQWFGFERQDVKAKVEEIFKAVNNAAEALGTQEKIIEYRQLLNGAANGNGGSATRVQRVNQLIMAEANFARGKALLTQGRFSAAAEQFKKATDILPSDAEFLAQYGWALYNIPHEKNVSADDLALRPRESAADLQFEARQLLQRAIELASDGQRCSPSGGYAHLYLGRVFMQQHIPEVARQHFEKALSCAPNLAEAVRELRMLNLQEKLAVAKQPCSVLEWLCRRSNRLFGWPKMKMPVATVETKARHRRPAAKKK